MWCMQVKRVGASRWYLFVGGGGDGEFCVVGWMGGWGGWMEVWMCDGWINVWVC